MAKAMGTRLSKRRWSAIRSEAASAFPRRLVLADIKLSAYRQALVGRDKAAMAIAKWIFPGILTFLAAACVAAPTPDSNRAAVPPPDVPKIMKEALVPGLQMAVIERGKVRLFSYGVADVQTGRAVSARTVFEAASIGKPVFAYGVLRLASQGRIDLDAPIGRYLPGLDPQSAALTARRLLSHSAFLTSNAEGGEKPGSPASPRFSYSGEGIRLLQRVVEQITGEGLQPYMQREVFLPLGMSSSSFVWREDYQERKAFGHGFTGSSAGRTHIQTPQAFSSLETTAGDYARFLLAATGGVGLSPDIKRQFLAPQVALEDCVVCTSPATSQPSATRHWGLGMGLEEVEGRVFAWHWGDNQTMQSYTAVTRDGDRGVVILTNSANGHSIIRHIASNILGMDAPGYAWVNSYEPYTSPARLMLSRIVRRREGAITEADLSLPPEQLRVVAERLTAGGRPADAAALIRRIVKAGRAEARDHLLLSNALRLAGDLPGAREAADTALRLDPGSKEAELALTRVAQSERVIPPALLRSFAGDYSSPYGLLEIRSDGRRLTARLPDQPVSALLPLGANSFLMEAMGVPILFVQDSAGKVTHATVRAGGEIRLERVSPAD
jgi:CubicO group peptidase (beta-lactamase class C family)